MSNLPSWARKPKHKKEVVATSRGWMVKDTGEYLKLVKDLDSKLEALNQEARQSLASVQQDEKPSDATQDDKKEDRDDTPSKEEKSADTKPDADTKPKTSGKTAKKPTGRRRGRPPKKKDA